jgi:hypothetical protein
MNLQEEVMAYMSDGVQDSGIQREGIFQMERPDNNHHDVEKKWNRVHRKCCDGVDAIRS